MGPHGKNIVSIPPPLSRYLFIGLQELSFELPREQVGVQPALQREWNVYNQQKESRVVNECLNMHG